MKQALDNGVHIITNDEYHSSLGISRSALWTFKKSPALYWHEYLNPDYVKPEPTPAMLLGDVVHCMVLEPKETDARYCVAPKLDRRTKVGKQMWDDFQVTAQGKQIVSNDFVTITNGINDTLQRNSTFMALLAGAKIEQSIFFTHERTGLQVKVRPDIWSGSLVADLKTTDSAAPRDFQASAYKYGYYLQAAMLSEGLRSQGIKMDKFVFACVEKREPYLEAIYVLDQDALDYGINLFNKLMDDYSICLLKNEWPGYGIQALGLPEYVRKDNYEG